MTTAARSERQALDELVESRRVVICCGSGGVGKTTTAAVLALEGARRGRRAVVVTIDPAKRLANALGLAHLSNVPTAIDAGRWRTDGASPDGASPDGRLHALMLDTKSTFDSLVVRHAGSAEQAERILVNTFYRNISGALGGTQEYMAMEKLHELHDDSSFDLIVVDTPPTRHALDFLDAPKRLVRLLDNRIFQLLMMPTRAYLRIASIAVQAFLRTVSRVVGTEVIDDVVAFFRAFEGMEAGFRERAAAVEALLADPSTAFVLVAAPSREAIEEADYFARRLRDHDQEIAALVVNRIHPMFGDETPEGLRARAASLRSTPPADTAAAARLAALYDNLADFSAVARRERRALEGVAEAAGSAPVSYVPFLPHDVHDFDALAEIGTALFGPPGDGDGDGDARADG